MSNKLINLIVLLVIVLLLALLSLPYITIKTNIDLTYEAIEFHTKDKDYMVQREVSVKGIYERAFFPRRARFIGTISIDGNNCFANREKSIEETYRFNKNGMCEISYAADKIGTLYVTPNMTSIVIFKRANNNFFDYNDTVVLFAPATNRKDAIAATEKRMKTRLKNYKIK